MSMEIKGPTGISPVTPSPMPTVAAASGTPTYSPQSSNADTLRLSGLLNLLQSGQRLDVLVVALENNQLVLQLNTPLQDTQGNRTWVQLRAPATIPAQVGQQLELEVVDPNPAQPILKLTAASAAPLNLQMALNAALSKQQVPTPFYANVAALNQSTMNKQLESLPTPVRNLIETLWRQLPEPPQLQTATAMKQALQHAGVFLEANLLGQLLNERIASAPDLRTTLLRLAVALQSQTSTATSSTRVTTGTVTQNAPASSVTSPANANLPLPPRTTDLPPHVALPQPQAQQEATLSVLKNLPMLLEQLQQQTETTLARMQTHQLHMASNEAHRAGWLLELPVRHEQGVDLFDLRIQPDAQGKRPGEAAHGWTILLAFDLAGLGPMRVQVQLQGERISAFWWAEQSHTTQLFQEHVTALQTRLQAAGLQIDQLRCQTGMPKITTTSKPAPYSNTMIDERI